MGKVVKYTLLILICAILLFPVWLMVTNSFTSARAFLKMPPRLVPEHLTLDNYKRAFTMPYITRWIFNTLLVMVSVVLAGILVNGAAGYVFAFAKFKWRNIIFWAMLAPIFVTRMALLISQFIVVGKLGLRGMAAVILMSIFWPTGIYLFRNYFQSISIDFVENARMDGAHEWTILTKIILPLSKPIIGAALVFMGMGVLGDYIWQSLNMLEPETQTFIVGLMKSTLDVYVVKNIGYNLAVGTLLFIPYLILFAFSSKYFIQGLTAGGVKG